MRHQETRALRSMVVLTGAGISVESGLPSFRGADGLWRGFRLEDVATPEAFVRDPKLVQHFYDERRHQLLQPSVQPNAAHQALATLERHWSGPFLLVTQNIDDLHERAGSRRLIHMHGELLKARCTACAMVQSCPGDLAESHSCSACRAKGCLRPHVVWFGEMPFELDRIETALRDASIFLSIGSSGQVYPAAGFVEIFHAHGNGRSIEVNLEPGKISNRFSEHRFGPASDTVPRLVEELLSQDQ